MRKKGEQSIGITIAIVIGVVLLVLLVFGVTDVWGLFRGEQEKYVGSNSNIDDLIGTCELRCSTENTYDYCNEVREIEVDGNSVINGSCYMFAEYGSDYKFEKCSAITCSNTEIDNIRVDPATKITDKTMFSKAITG